MTHLAIERLLEADTVCIYGECEPQVIGKVKPLSERLVAAIHKVLPGMTTVSHLVWCLRMEGWVGGFSDTDIFAQALKDAGFHVRYLTANGRLVAHVSARPF